MTITTTATTTTPRTIRSKVIPSRRDQILEGLDPVVQVYFKIAFQSVGILVLTRQVIDDVLSGKAESISHEGVSVAGDGERVTISVSEEWQADFGLDAGEAVISADDYRVLLDKWHQFLAAGPKPGEGGVE